VSWRNALFIAVLTCAAFAQSPTADYRRITVGESIEFPRDHGAHPDTKTEWWYLTGHFEDAEGREFGLQFTIFRSALSAQSPAADASPLRAHQVYLGHLALADIRDGELRFAERMRRAGSPLATASTTDMDLALDDWMLTRIEGDRMELRAADPTVGLQIELELMPRKPLVLHGDDGVSAKGAEPGNASVYSSWTRLGAQGLLSIDGKPHRIRGECWFDHEYGSSVLGAGVRGWDWFGLQLDDGGELMLFYLRHEDGTPQPASAGTLIDREGRAIPLSKDDFSIAASGAWKSPRNGASYPNAWRILVPAHDLDLNLTPRIADCEIGSESGTGVTYWEGPVRITGTQTGRGYAELTGYAGSMTGRF
jgi:predicted secreted hydrolase